MKSVLTWSSSACIFLNLVLVYFRKYEVKKLSEHNTPIPIHISIAKSHANLKYNNMYVQVHNITTEGHRFWYWNGLAIHYQNDTHFKHPFVASLSVQGLTQRGMGFEYDRQSYILVSKVSVSNSSIFALEVNIIFLLGWKYLWFTIIMLETTLSVT